jgi:hypothetical protein
MLTWSCKSRLTVSQAHKAFFAIFVIVPIWVETICLIHHVESSWCHQFTSVDASDTRTGIQVTVEILRVLYSGTRWEPRLSKDYKWPIAFFCFRSHRLSVVFAEIYDLSESLVRSCLVSFTLTQQVLSCHSEIYSNHLVSLLNKVFHDLLVQCDYAVVSLWFKQERKFNLMAINRLQFERVLIDEEVISDCLHLNGGTIDLLVRLLLLTGLLLDFPRVVPISHRTRSLCI